MESDCLCWFFENKCGVYKIQMHDMPYEFDKESLAAMINCVLLYKHYFLLHEDSVRMGGNLLYGHEIEVFGLEDAEIRAKFRAEDVDKSPYVFRLDYQQLSQLAELNQ